MIRTEGGSRFKRSYDPRAAYKEPRGPLKSDCQLKVVRPVITPDMMQSIIIKKECDQSDRLYKYSEEYHINGARLEKIPVRSKCEQMGSHCKHFVEVISIRGDKKEMLMDSSHICILLEEAMLIDKIANPNGHDHFNHNCSLQDTAQSILSRIFEEAYIVE